MHSSELGPILFLVCVNSLRLGNVWGNLIRFAANKPTGLFSNLQNIQYFYEINAICLLKISATQTTG